LEKRVVENRSSGACCEDDFERRIEAAARAWSSGTRGDGYASVSVLTPPGTAEENFWLNGNAEGENPLEYSTVVLRP
jgi:hypothetical protein